MQQLDSHAGLGGRGRRRRRRPLPSPVRSRSSRIRRRNATSFLRSPSLLLLLLLPSAPSWLGESLGWRGAAGVSAEVQSVSRVYAAACMERGPDYFDYERFELELHPSDLPALSSSSRGSTGRRRSSRTSKTSRTSSYGGQQHQQQDQQHPQRQQPPVHDMDAFEIVRHLGGGKFSEVFEALTYLPAPSDNPSRAVPIPIPCPTPLVACPVADVSSSSSGLDGSRSRVVVLKVLRPTQLRKIKREVKILQTLNSGANTNTIKLEGLCAHPVTQEVTLVLEHVGSEAQWLCHGGREGRERLSAEEVQLYMYKLLQALDYCHSVGIMHRDVKPRNVMINRRTKELRLIDFGLGDFYLPGKRYPARVGSRYYKAPELLLGYRFYDYSVDIFSAGCVLAGLIFQREPFFRGTDTESQLVCVAQVLGSAALHEYAGRYGVKLNKALKDGLARAAVRQAYGQGSQQTSPPQRQQRRGQAQGQHQGQAQKQRQGQGQSQSQGQGQSQGQSRGDGRAPPGEMPRVAWSSLVRALSPGGGSPLSPLLCSDEALDLLGKMLCYDHQQRITAAEALRHPFFRGVASSSSSSGSSSSSSGGGGSGASSGGGGSSGSF